MIPRRRYRVDMILLGYVDCKGFAEPVTPPRRRKGKAQFWRHSAAERFGREVEREMFARRRCCGRQEVWDHEVIDTRKESQ